VDLEALNLYGTETGGQGPADVTVTGATHGAQRGSLIEGTDGTMHFIRTGGPLAPDTYTVRLRSGAQGFPDLAGNEPNGDFVTSFEVQATGAAVLGVPDFARGQYELVDVPASDSGFPICLTGAAGVETVEFTLRYDPDLLVIDGLMPGEDLPVGSLFSADFGESEVTLRVQLGSPLGGEAIDLVRLFAFVPGLAPTGAAHLLDLADVTLNGGAVPVTVDDGVHVVATLGDANGDGFLSQLDSELVERVAQGSDSGFAAYPTIDPALIADLTGNAEPGTLGATLTQQDGLEAQVEILQLWPSAGLANGNGALAAGSAPLTVASTPSPSLIDWRDDFSSRAWAELQQVAPPADWVREFVGNGATDEALNPNRDIAISIPAVV
jgi:hypothetical protein